VAFPPGRLLEWFGRGTASGMASCHHDATTFCVRTPDPEATMYPDQRDSERGGSSVGQSSGLIIRRSQVRSLPAPPIYLRLRGEVFRRWGESRIVSLCDGARVTATS
jgi:hypothetical protein